MITAATRRPCAVREVPDLSKIVPGIEWAVELFVAGTPAPQGSKMARPIYKGRGADRQFTGKVAQVESSKAGVTEWRGDVRHDLARALTARAVDQHDDQADAILDGPLVLDVEFVMPRPAGAPKRSTPSAVAAPDLSKLVRSTEDAITAAGAWTDDARIVLTLSRKRVAEIGERPGAMIRIGVMP